MFWPITPMAYSATSVTRNTMYSGATHGKTASAASSRPSSRRVIGLRANRRSSRYDSTRSTGTSRRWRPRARRSRVERRDEVGVARFERPSLDLLGRRHVALFLVQAAGQQREPLDRLHLGERRVDLVHLDVDQPDHLGVLGEVLERGERDAVVLRELRHVVLVDEDERG